MIRHRPGKKNANADALSRNPAASVGMVEGDLMDSICRCGVIIGQVDVLEEVLHEGMLSWEGVRRQVRLLQDRSC